MIWVCANFILDWSTKGLAAGQCQHLITLIPMNDSSCPEPPMEILWARFTWLHEGNLLSNSWQNQTDIRLVAQPQGVMQGGVLQLWTTHSFADSSSQLRILFLSRLIHRLPIPCLPSNGAVVVSCSYYVVAGNQRIIRVLERQPSEWSCSQRWIFVECCEPQFRYVQHLLFVRTDM